MALFSAIKNYIFTIYHHVLHPRIPSIKPAALAIQDLEYLAVHEPLALPGFDPPLVNPSQSCDQTHQPVLCLDPRPPAAAEAYLTSPELNFTGESLIIPGMQYLADHIPRYSSSGAGTDITIDYLRHCLGINTIHWLFLFFMSNFGIHFNLFGKV